MRSKALLFRSVFVAVVSAIASHPYNIAQQSSQPIEVVAKRFSFSPSEITVRKGQLVVLLLRSEDVAHGLRIRELGVDLKIPKNGGVAEVRFTPGVVGDFVAHCSSFCGTGHGSMSLTVHVLQ